MWAKQKYSGFTIVELLIVIVVIAILAAITIVAYNGIQDRARASAASQALSSAAKKIKLWQAEQDSTLAPSSLVAAGVSNSSGIIYQYTQGSNGAYCITASVSGKSYTLTEATTTPSVGTCTGHVDGGIITNLATNPDAVGSASGFSGMGSNQAGSNLSIATDRYHNGTTSLKRIITSTNTGGIGVRAPIISTRVNAGEKLAWSFWVYSSRAGTMTTHFEGVRVSDGTTYVGCIGDPATFTIPINTWTQVSATCSPTVDAYLTGGGAYNLQVQVGDTIWYDEFMTTKTNAVQNYGDGSSPGWAWNGTANNATSTGPPQ